MYEVEIKGDNIREVILKLDHAMKVMNRQPTHILLNEIAASRLIFEGKFEHTYPKTFEVKDLVGCRYYGLEILIKKDYSASEYVEVLEILEAKCLK